MPSVSVIIPAYNVEKYIARTIESLLKQDFDDFEIIIINDGSSDKTVDVINGFNDARIKLFSQDNKGSAMARNLGISKAQGEYLMFLDGDDYYDIDCISSAYNKIKLENSDICIFGSRFVNKNGEKVKGVIPKFVDSVDLKEHKELLLEIENCTWDKIYRKTLIVDNDIRYPEGLYYEDFAFTFWAVIFASKISFINRELITYVVGRDGNATNEMSEKVFDIFAIVEFIIEKYQEEGVLDDYYEELKAISIINIVDKLKQVILSEDKNLKYKYLNYSYEFIKEYFGDFKSPYNLKKHPRDYIYFDKNLLKLYMIIKGVN